MGPFPCWRLDVPCTRHVDRTSRTDKLTSLGCSHIDSAVGLSVHIFCRAPPLLKTRSALHKICRPYKQYRLVNVKITSFNSFYFICDQLPSVYLLYRTWLVSIYQYSSCLLCWLWSQLKDHWTPEYCTLSSLNVKGKRVTLSLSWKFTQNEQEITKEWTSLKKSEIWIAYNDHSLRASSRIPVFCLTGHPGLA